MFLISNLRWNCSDVSIACRDSFELLLGAAGVLCRSAPKFVSTVTQLRRSACVRSHMLVANFPETQDLSLLRSTLDRRNAPSGPPESSNQAAWFERRFEPRTLGIGLRALCTCDPRLGSSVSQSALGLTGKRRRLQGSLGDQQMG